MTTLRLHRTVGVRVGRVQVGGGAPIVVQSMTSTDTADVQATVRQALELAEAGSELVRVTVNTPEAARAVPEIKRRLLDLYRETQATDPLEKLTSIGREGLDITPLPLGIERVEGERAFPRAARPGDDDQLVPGEVDVDPLQVVLRRLLDADLFEHASILT